MLSLLRQKGLINKAPAPHQPQAQARPQSGPARTRAADLVMTALNFLDLPYRYGGQSVAGGFDCSAFTRHVFATNLGLTLPRRSDDQAHASSLKDVERSELKPGDLVFFNTLQRTFSHVGIYVGEGRFVHAPRTGAKIRLENMGLAYWDQRFTGARRLAQWD
jgi:cell wall-associated NlpC family hydrolase